MSDDKSTIRVRETIVVKKFEGDDQTGEPIEVITIEQENGVVLSVNVERKGEETNGTN